MRLPVLRMSRVWAFMGLALLVSGQAWAQQGGVTGKVTDESNGQPLVGARVQATTQQVFAVTNQQGQYVLRGMTPGAHTLRVFMLGYASQTKSLTVAADGSGSADWSLKAVPFQLEEIVTTATGEQLTRELGNTVGKIQAAQLVETAPTTNLSQVLSGRIAGVSVLQSNGTSGTGARIRIRGLSSVSLSNDPLLYIESLPSRETRAFIERVLTNYWIYRQRMGLPTPSLDAIAQGGWPIYADTDGFVLTVSENAQD